MEWSRGRFLGRGSSANVSIATSNSGETFAVKSMDLYQSESLEREQQFLSTLSSPFVVSYKGCDITTENNHLVFNLLMEYMPGGTLVDAIRGRDGGRLTHLEISNHTRQVLQGLEYLHSHGIVHCDIKGHNILVGESGTKIADLGCAKRANQAAPIRGTPMFMAPEVARGQEQGFPADIWALGCTVIEMATGASPWPNVNDPISVLYRIVFSGESPEIPDEFSDQAKDFVSKCLMRDPKERWTAKQLLKHPYLEVTNDEPKHMISQESDGGSPTSILDQDVWRSVEEPASVGAERSLKQRIKQLADKSDMPSWRQEEEEEMEWMMIRSNGGCGVMAGEDMVVGCTTMGGAEKDELSIDTSKVSCRYSTNRSGNSNVSEFRSHKLFRSITKNCKDLRF